MPTANVRERLQEIVQAVFAGSANAAAQAADVEASTLHRILEAKVAEPRLSTLQRLAEAYGVPVTWMLGESSSDAVQIATKRPGEALVLPLPTPYWLILSFHRAKQSKLRNWLATAEAKSAKARKIISDFRDFEFAVPAEDFPLPAISDLIEHHDPIPDDDVAVVRRCAELETSLLELAVQRAKRANKAPE